MDHVVNKILRKTHSFTPIEQETFRKINLAPLCVHTLFEELIRIFDFGVCLLSFVIDIA